jgi:hypothetical protein
LEGTREKQLAVCKGVTLRLSANLSAETLQSKRDWNDTFKVLKGKSCQERILYSARHSFIIEEEIKTLRQRLEELITTRPALQEIPNTILQAEIKDAN